MMVFLKKAWAIFKRVEFCNHPFLKSAGHRVCFNTLCDSVLLRSLMYSQKVLDPEQEFSSDALYSKKERVMCVFYQFVKN